MNDIFEINKKNNSEIIRYTLFSLITVATSKTSDDYAWSSIKNILKKSEKNYHFLQYVAIGDLEDIDYIMEDIKINSDINSIHPRDLGRAIQDIIDSLKTKLGKKAGYFFLDEFKSKLGEEYHSIIKSIGVDLRLIELQQQIGGLRESGYQLKDSKDSNIAFIKRE